MKKSLTTLLLAGMLCISFLADAQSTVSLKRKGDRYSGGAVMSEKATVTEIRKDMKPVGVEAREDPIENAAYSDYLPEDMAKRMTDRKWEREDTAWEMACTIDTKESYRRYVAMYPSGPHRAEASKRIIDFEVNDVFNGEHGTLPGMKHVEEDEESPTSTIVVENATEYVLTVMYSGPESKSIQIPPYGRNAVTLQNGRYRIAASVPRASVRPYAGSESLSGGRYEAGYCIVYGLYTP